jgi:hypothetical protein
MIAHLRQSLTSAGTMNEREETASVVNAAPSFALGTFSSDEKRGGEGSRCGSIGANVEVEGLLPCSFVGENGPKADEGAITTEGNFLSRVARARREWTREDAGVPGTAAVAALVAILFLVACPAPLKRSAARAKPGASGPMTTATVLTIRTQILPEKKAFRSLIVAADGHIRIGDELDHWRLFDTKNDTVTFVDDIGKTFRTVGRDQILNDRRHLLAQPLPDGIDRATIENTGVVRNIGHWPARQYHIRLGAYHRELWLSASPILGESFLTLLTASDPLGEKLPGVMRDVQMELMQSSGVPVADRAEMPLGKGTLVIDRQLQSVEQRPVPTAWLTIPSSYRDLDAPVRGPAAGRPPVSSPPRDQTAPARE